MSTPLHPPALQPAGAPRLRRWAPALVSALVASAASACLVPEDSNVGPEPSADREPGGDDLALGATEQALATCAVPGGALVPSMTGPSTPAGGATASGTYSAGYEAWRAFDGTTSTLWLSNMYTSAVWIAYEWGGGTSQTVASYEVRYANGSCCEQRGPKSWTLQGWTGSSWVTVDTVTSQTGWYASPTRTFTVDAPGSYVRYRLHITADNYNNATYPVTLVSIASIQLFGGVSSPQIPALAGASSPAGSATASGIYSGGYEAWRAFDNTTATLWLSNMYTSSVWVAYQFGGGGGRVATSYEVRYANGSCCEQRGPRNWALQGWTGSTWETVDTVSGQTGWYSNPTRGYIVDSPGCYSQYRLLTTADNYNDPTYPITLVSIATIQLYGY
jgi:hypothetical protein